MGYLELDLSLSDEDRAIRDLSRRFAAEVIRPAGIELDRLTDPADVIAESSVVLVGFVVDIQVVAIIRSDVVFNDDILVFECLA